MHHGKSFALGSAQVFLWADQTKQIHAHSFMSPFDGNPQGQPVRFVALLELAQAYRQR